METVRDETSDSRTELKDINYSLELRKALDQILAGVITRLKNIRNNKFDNQEDNANENI